MEIVLPNKKYLASYKEANKEYLENKIESYEFLDADKYDIFDMFKNYSTGVNLPKGYVPATYLWMVDEDRFIGEVSIRHSLTKSLLRFCGNIGYGVRYSKWSQGYGTIILQQALKYAFEVIGLNKVLITCSDSNIPSYKIIEKNEGILKDTIMIKVNENNRLTRRYWIFCDS